MKHRPCSSPADHDERGAALILAVGVMLLVGLISGSLLAYITTSVQGRSDLDTIRNRQYAADAAIEYAIDQVRALGDRPFQLRRTVLFDTQRVDDLRDLRREPDQRTQCW
jgi:type II secretory pathway component PulK